MANIEFLITEDQRREMLALCRDIEVLEGRGGYSADKHEEIMRILGDMESILDDIRDAPTTVED